jgi:signal transduction histidine kinase
MSSQVREKLGRLASENQTLLQRLFNPILSWLERLKPQPESSEYQGWRSGFLRDRLRLCGWIAIFCYSTISISGLYVVFHSSGQWTSDVLSFYRDIAVVDQLRNATVASTIVQGVLLVVSLLFQRTPLGRRYPTLGFLSFSWTFTLSNQIIGCLYHVPVISDHQLVFLAQATLMPVYWQLHLFSQFVPIAFYTVVYPLMGLTKLGERSIYNSYAIDSMVELFWVCLICNLAVYLYERLKRSEFEAQRHLQVFLHSVSHDLQNPVMGTTVVLKNLLRKSGDELVVKRPVIERLLEGNDRQLTLINALLEAHRTEIQGIRLDRKPVHFKSLIKSVLLDFEHELTRNKVEIQNYVSDHLPWVDGDVDQLWRVFSNLIGNALKHNPPGIILRIDAEMVEQVSPETGQLQKYLRCLVQDNGLGIPVKHQERLFELYVRGSRARYMPGLGIGLYLCRQIVMAHDGEIGVISQPDAGTLFWLTLPLSPLDRAT